MSGSGLKTWLPAEVKKQLYVREKLIESFRASGYEPIIIPSLVDIESVDRSQETSFKVVDRDGKLLALRTDLTHPIAKAVASRSSELEFPLKLYYASAVWRYSARQTDDSREIQQTGIELIGASEGDADISVVQLLVSSLETLSLKDWTLSITHSSIWQAAFAKYPGLAKEAYNYLANGDLVAFNSRVAKHPLQALLDADISAVEKILDIDLSLLSRIKKLSKNIVFDSSQTPDLKLYSGLHFTLHVSGEGNHVAQGGRYDKLYPSFGADLGAIGFAFYMPGLVAAMLSRGLIGDCEADQASSLRRSNPFRIALTKGTLLDGAFKFLHSIGISSADVDMANFDKDKLPKHKLILDASAKDGSAVEILLVRGHDVPAYIEHGAADLGIVGIDVVVDAEADVIKLKNLDYGHCRLAVAVPQGKYKSITDLPNYARVATSFPNLASKYFSSKGIEVEIVNLYGSVEIAPLTNLSDIIVDLVASGKTLKENGLEPIADIMQCSAYLVANKSSYKLNKTKFLEMAV